MLEDSGLVSGNCLEVSAWFHPFMQDADDFNQSRLDRPIVEHMHWFPHLRVWSIAARIPQMKAAKSGQQFLSGLGERAFRISRDFSHRCGKENGVAAASFGSPLLGAGSKNVGEIGLSRSCQTKTRHRELAGAL